MNSFTIDTVGYTVLFGFVFTVLGLMAVKFTGMNLELLMNGWLHMALLLLILTTFYWLKVTKISAEAVHNQLKDAIHQMMITAKIHAQTIPGLRKQIRETISNQQPMLLYATRMYSKEDQRRTIQNESLFRFNVLMLGFLFVGFFFVNFLLRKTCANGQVQKLRLFIYNLITFLCVGLIEVYFFFNIASQYSPSKPSFLTELVFRDVTKRLQ